MKYKVLNRCHPEYNAGQYSELCDLYKGGWQILQNAQHYLPKAVSESDNRYRQRLKEASYIPYFGEIIDFFVSNLFAQDLTVTPPSDAEHPETPGTIPDEKYYSEFYRNADRAGTPFADVLKEAFRDAIIYRRSAICVDYPESKNNAADRAEEDRLGLADAYIYHTPAEELHNWKRDDYGNLEWVIVKRCYMDDSDPYAEEQLCVDEFTVWSFDKDGYAVWKTFTVKYKPESPPNGNTDVEVTDSGETKFRAIPILIMEIPEGLWVGNKVGPLCKEHFRRRSLLNAAEAISMMAIPYAKLAPETGSFQGALPSEAQQDPHRGDDIVGKFKSDGYIVLGSEDDIGFVEPVGNAYNIVDKELQELRDEMFRVVHQMAQGVATSSGGALRRSGMSKIKDSEATVIILGEYGRIVRRFAEKIYKTISDSRNEDVYWIARGLDTFEVDQRQQIIDEATKVDMINIPSVTFKTEYKTLLAFQLLGNVHSNIQQAIREEIREGVAHDYDLLQGLVDKGLMMPGAPPGLNPPPAQTAAASAGPTGAQNSKAISDGMHGRTKESTKKGKLTIGAPQPRQAGGKFGFKAG